MQKIKKVVYSIKILRIAKFGEESVICMYLLIVLLSAPHSKNVLVVSLLIRIVGRYQVQELHVS